ncbi:MAG: 4-(cytidine 5'-diphospho)-2-C-methyl-D-erythritol kinase [Christensenellales bacterium]
MLIVEQAHAKINWSLDVLATRADGYHEMDMLMQTIELSDELRFQRAKWLSLTINGRQLPVGGKNLVVRAANALCEFMGKRYGARITLKKRIPVRAGLGGGSADCAAALIALNRLWRLNLPKDRLMQIGATLGADVPFCMEGGFARVTGVGDRMEHLPRPPRIPLVLLIPEEGLSTARVFEAYDEMALPPLGLDIPALSDALGAHDYAAAAALCGNALEAPAIAMLPEIRASIDRLRNHGARFARMTGSGSCVFGAFRTVAEAMAAIEEMRAGILTWTMGEP